MQQPHLRPGRGVDQLDADDAQIGDLQQRLHPEPVPVPRSRSHQQLAGDRAAPRHVVVRGDEPEAVVEEAVHRGEIGIVEGRTDGQEQRVRPGLRHQARNAGGQLAAGKAELVGRTIETHVPTPVPVHVQPLGLHPLVGQGEAVAVARVRPLQHQVHLEPGGLCATGGVERERFARHPTRGGPGRHGLTHCRAHGVHRGQQVGLAGGVGAVDTDRRKHREVTGAGSRAGQQAATRTARDERQLVLAAQGPEVRNAEADQHRDPLCPPSAGAGVRSGVDRGGDVEVVGLDHRHRRA